METMLTILAVAVIIIIMSAFIDYFYKRKIYNKVSSLQAEIDELESTIKSCKDNVEKNKLIIKQSQLRFDQKFYKQQIKDL